MNRQQPPGPAPYSRARERYAKRRRRQLAMMAAAGVVTVGLLAVIVLLVFLIRGCNGLLAGSRTIAGRGSTDARRARQVAIQEFRPAPWLVEFDGERLYAAGDTQQRTEILTSWPIDQLAAYAVGDKEPVWQRPVDADYSEFYLGSNRLVGFKQSLTEPPKLQLDTYNADSGESEWSFTLDKAAHGCIAAAGPQVVIGYELPDGYRLASYDLLKHALGDAAKEAKSWGIRLPLEGLVGGEFASEVYPEIEVRLWPDLVVYKQFNVIGFVEAGTGRRLREYAAPAFIHRFTVDPVQRLCYIVHIGNQEGTFAIVAVPCGAGSPQSIHRFEGLGEDVKLAADNGGLAVAYPLVSDETEGQRSKVVGFRGNSLVFEQELTGLVRTLFTHEHAAQAYFAAVNSGVDDMGYPTGRSVLWRFDMQTGKGDVVARYSRPIMAVHPFKQDCLVLLLGGDIYSFMPATGASRRLRRARYPVLSALASPDESRVAVFASTKKHYANEPNQPMQVIVFE